MDTSPPREISVLEPVGAAFDKMKEILFQPFDIGKWFTIGFCAWLATLGNGGGFNGGGGGGGPSSGGRPVDFQHELNQLKEGILQHLHIIIPIAVIVFLLILIISLVVMWLKSRGQFMFLHCVARNVAEVKNPWKRYAAQANSLFLFKLVLWLAGMAISLLFIVPIVLLVVPMIRTDFEVLMFAPIMGIVFLILVGILIGIVFSAVNTLTRDFVVPVMYIHRCRVMEGWRAFWGLCSANIIKFVLFLLFLIVVNIAIGMLIFFAVLFTCCCAACILAIPYLGTVLMLPILVWRRAYSALFLAQFGPAFDVFALPEGVVVPDDLPTPPEVPGPDTTG